MSTSCFVWRPATVKVVGIMDKVDSVLALEELTVWRERQTDEWIIVFCLMSAVMEVGTVCAGAGGLDTWFP